MSRLNKIKNIFASRRFWGALAMSAGAMIFHALGMMTPEQATNAFETAWGLYIGSHGIEDAARAFGIPPKVIDVGSKVLEDGKIDSNDIRHLTEVEDKTRDVDTIHPTSDT